MGPVERLVSHQCMDGKRKNESKFLKHCKIDVQ